MFHRTRVRCPNCGHVTALDVVWATSDACPHCQGPIETPAVGSTVSSPTPEPDAEEDPEPTIARWVEAFNSRDLNGMLEHMGRGVDFHPLRLSGLEKEYLGHDGVRQWFEQLIAMGHDHRIELSEVRDAGSGQALAFGEVNLLEGADITPFWSLTRLRDGKIAAAYHYLTDPDIMEYVRVGE